MLNILLGAWGWGLWRTWQRLKWDWFPHSSHWFVFVTTTICIFVTSLIYICYQNYLCLLHYIFVFTTSKTCYCYTTDLYLLQICITRLHWMYDSLIGSRRAINTLYNIKEIYNEYELIVERQNSKWKWKLELIVLHKGKTDLG